MQWFNKIPDKGISGLIILFLSLLFIPYIVLCFYAHPIADDYTYGPESPFWNTQLELYIHWNGRYIANFFIMANPILCNSSFATLLVVYRLSALILLMLVPVSILFFLNSAIAKAISGLKKVIGAIIISLLIVALLPSLPEGIDWYPGAMTYILGCIVAFIYAGMVIRYFNDAFFMNRIFHACLCILLLCIAVGFNEVQMLLLGFGHLLLFLSFKREGRFRSFGFVLLVCCIVFSSFMFFAPGNHFRGEYFPNSHKFLTSTCMSVLQMFRFFFSFVSKGPLWIASILFAPISYKLSQSSPFFQRISRFKPFFLFSILWVVLFLCVFPAYWSTGILGQHRTLNTACFYFIPMWFLFLHSLYSKDNLSEKISNGITKPIKIGIITILLLSLLLTGNSGQALMELGAGKIVAFDKEMNLRYTLLEAAKKTGNKEVSLTPLQNKPSSLYVLDIQPGCNHWINQQQAHFFGLQKICGDSAITFNTK